MLAVAYDIATLPVPLGEMTCVQQRRYHMELRRQLLRAPEMAEEDASRFVRSLHPFLSRICCISAVSGRLAEGPNTPRSWTAASPEEEAAMLAHFWSDIEGFPKAAIWTTFNGKRFDAPYLKARSARYGLRPSRQDLLSTYPYRNRPHADLACVWPVPYSLDDLCGLLGVPPPKTGMDGSQIEGAVEEGRLGEVVWYCEADAVATFGCLRAMPFIL